MLEVTVSSPQATEHGLASIREADAILDRMRQCGYLEIDAVFCNAFLNCARLDGSHEALDSALELFHYMRRSQRDSYTYSNIISLVGKIEGPEKARELLDKARSDGVKPNTFMYNALLKLIPREDEVSLQKVISEMEAQGVRGDKLTEKILEEL